MFKVMVIEDDMALRENIESYLKCKGYDVCYAENFKNIIKEYDMNKPDIVLLDINLPYENGFTICSNIRKISETPIIFISARNEDFEQVMGIEMGADDYITKPFSLELLHVKIKSILKRCNKSNDNQIVQVKGLCLDKKAFKLSYKGKSIELSKNEFRLINKFIEKKDTVVSREELLNELWDESTFIDDNTLTVNVTRVKNILTSFDINNAIKTKRGIGYIFDTSAIE